jgi:D-amino-acid dehydrogenase
MTPDCRPIIGWSPIDGLFINSGHGMLGWDAGVRQRRG